MKIVHLAKKEASAKIMLPAFQDALRELGEVEVVEHGQDMTEQEVLSVLRRGDVILTDWMSQPLPVTLAADPGNVRYVCNLTGTIQGFIPPEIINAGIPVSNWGDATAIELAESSLTLLLAALKEIPARIRRVESGKWRDLNGLRQGHLHGLRLGLYGFGHSGKAFLNLVRPFQVDVHVYDPFVQELPDGVRRADDLDALFSDVHAVSIHAALTPETRGSVDAALLAKLPDGGIIVNTARGDIIDQGALFAELASGRLRAGLDVLADGDWLPPEHEARAWPNLLLTCHQLNMSTWPDPEAMHFMHGICLDNLRRFQNGEPIRFLFDSRRLALST
ncbi:MAG: hypothetical protein JJU29_17625 [Verrucomicrobia bacterium]|nr:hypothetical protein [Verrucomicrobiota bacterium]MCH8512884.1 hypothetical protein [Kiritimatiellia bacterium]